MGLKVEANFTVSTSLLLNSKSKDVERSLESRREFLVETLLYTSGIWEKAVKLLRVTVEFESNTTRAESPSGV